METTLTTANYSEFKKLQSFENKNAMDVAIRKFLYTFSHKLTEGAKKVLKVLQQHACKIAGVAWMKYKTLADAAGISLPTAKRAVKLLETFGIIDKKATLRVEGKHRGGNGHNVYIIREVEGVKELPNDTPRDTPRDTPTKSVKPRRDNDDEQEYAGDTLFKTKPSKRNKNHKYNKFKNWVSKAKTKPKVNSASMTFEEAKKAELEAKGKKQGVRVAPMPKYMQKQKQPSTKPPVSVTLGQLKAYKRGELELSAEVLNDQNVQDMLAMLT